MNLDDNRRLALVFPAAREAPHHAPSSFRVGDRIFATVRADGEHLMLDESAARCAATEPGVVLLRWGSPVAGVRVNLADAADEVVETLIYGASLRQAASRGAAPYLPPGARNTHV